MLSESLFIIISVENLIFGNLHKSNSKSKVLINNGLVGLVMLVKDWLCWLRIGYVGQGLVMLVKDWLCWLRICYVG